MYTDKHVIRKELVQIGRRIADKGLVVGPGGNTSARLKTGSKDIIYMKASGKCFEDAVDTDYIGVDLETGKVVDGNAKPTCEISMHLNCYRLRPEINAVIHTHAPLSTAYAMLGKPLKSFSPDFCALVGFEIPVGRYVLPSGTELAGMVGKFIKQGHKAVLMSNHGLLTAGANLKEAFYRTLIIEDGIKTVIASKILGKFTPFTLKQAAEVDNLDAEKYRRKLLRK
jgi:L-fuculose-phosphate aldolase